MLEDAYTVHVVRRLVLKHVSVTEPTESTDAFSWNGRLVLACCSESVWC